jgi:hypothetical protein
MTSNEREQLIFEMKKMAKDVKSSSKAKKLFVRLGTHTKDGKLKQAYK